MTTFGALHHAESGAGPAILFLHGVGGDAASWAPQLASFGRTHRAMAWDMPGYGASDPLESPTFAALADACVTLLDRQGVDRAHLVGHSIGGMVAQEVAARHPDRLASLTLSATSPAFGNPDGDFQKKFVAARLKPLAEGRTMAEIARDVVPRLVGPDADPAGVAAAVASMSRVPEATYRAMVELIVTFDRRDTLGAIAAPCLVLAGETDAQAPAPMMERMAGKIPGALFTCIPGAGHLANLERPAAFDAALTDFLTRLSGD
ncbi:MAG: alpha/beta fold hydrolase [Rhodobacterales bacterium]|nr:alpha/beta fold hydrolase [Rhodobacterales bacterium]